MYNMTNESDAIQRQLRALALRDKLYIVEKMLFSGEADLMAAFDIALSEVQINGQHFAGPDPQKTGIFY